MVADEHTPKNDNPPNAVIGARVVPKEEQVRSDMRGLLRILEIVKSDFPQMELPQLAVFLAVVTEPGVATQDLLGTVGLKRSALSRNVKALSELSYLTDDDGDPRPGLGLITQIPDLEDARVFHLAPTKPGYSFAKKLSRMMKG